MRDTNLSFSCIVIVKAGIKKSHVVSWHVTVTLLKKKKKKKNGLLASIVAFGKLWSPTPFTTALLC